MDDIDDNLDPYVQSPTPEAFRRLVLALETYVSLTGPNVPPGYAESTPFSGWARFRWQRTVEAVAELQRAGCPRDRAILPDHIDRCLIEADPIQGWPDDVCEALARLRSELVALFGVDGWDIIWSWRRLDENPHHWQEPKWLSVGLGTRNHEVSDPEPGSILMPFPLLVDPKQHRALRWVASVLAKEVKRAGADHGLTGNDARNKYLYDERIKGVPWKDILKVVNRTEGWDEIEDSSNALKYADKHAYYGRLPLLPRNRKSRGVGGLDDLKQPED